MGDVGGGGEEGELGRYVSDVGGGVEERGYFVSGTSRWEVLVMLFEVSKVLVP